jgi:uncharacterized Zn finger protein
MNRTTLDDACVAIHLDCEVCSKTTELVVPRQRAPFGLIDCPGCGATYMVSLDWPNETALPPDAVLRETA